MTQVGHEPGRGKTTVSDRVIEKIASQAADEIAFSGGPAARYPGAAVVRGLALGRGDHRRPRVDAKVDGHLARVSVTMSVRYPVPLRQVAVEVRTHVVKTVGALAGLEVREVDIEVSDLVRDRAESARVQ